MVSYFKAQNPQAVQLKHTLKPKAHKESIKSRCAKKVQQREGYVIKFCKSIFENRKKFIFNHHINLKAYILVSQVSCKTLFTFYVNFTALIKINDTLPWSGLVFV